MTKATAVREMLARSALFEVLHPSDQALVAEQMRDIALEPGQVLFSRSDPGRDLYLVVNGRVRLSVLSVEGRELSFDHAVAGDVFGEIAALDDAPRSADATAITQTHLKTLSGSALHKLIESRPALAQAVIKLLCTRLRDVSEHFEAIALHPVDVRLARLLLDRLEGQACADANSATLPLDMTQSELGLLIGTTRQRANTALASLEKAGAISRSQDRLECALPQLRRIARRD